MACRTCMQAVQEGGRAVQELAVFRPDLLPELPPGMTWEQIGELLIRLAGNVRQDLESSNQTP